MGFSPCFNASAIGLTTRVCGGTVSMMKVGSRALAYPPIYMRCVRGVHWHEMVGAPDQGVWGDLTYQIYPPWNLGDQIPNTIDSSGCEHRAHCAEVVSPCLQWHSDVQHLSWIARHRKNLCSCGALIRQTSFIPSKAVCPEMELCRHN
jgi:hypothetical protein